jgi:hypothetical protein
MQISSTRPAITALSALIIAAAHLTLSTTVSAHSGSVSSSHSGGMSTGAMGTGTMGSPLHSSAGPALRIPMNGQSTMPGATPPNAATSPGTQATQQRNAVVNPNTCDPETSQQCAVEDLELQEMQTPQPAPPLFKQPTPAPLPTQATPTPSTQANPMENLNPPLPETPNELSSGGTPRQGPLFGGGGSTLADCMSIWDRTTDMSKSEWRATCVRTLNGIDLPTEGLASTTEPKHRRNTPSVMHAQHKGGTRSATSTEARNAE